MDKKLKSEIEKIVEKECNRPIYFERLLNAAYGKKDSDYGCFIEKKETYNTIPHNYTRHTKLGELVKI